MLPKRELTRLRNENICAMIKKGYTYQEIGDNYGMTKQRVHQIYKKVIPTLPIDKGLTRV